MREYSLILVVLDTNAFHGDVRADRSRLRAILDGAVAKGAFELFVPEVVVQELDKQFARRSKKVVREINKAVGQYETELRELGLTGPPAMSHDEADVAGYRAALEIRLGVAGAQILPLPADLSPALAWSVNRRKPFKESGEGFPDVVIWLAVLELAMARNEPIVLVTSNTKDFGDGTDLSALAPELCDDLVASGRPRDQVRLVPGIGAFADEVGKQLQSARKHAEDLASRKLFDAAIERTVLYAPLDQHALELGVHLDSDPLVTGFDLESFSVEDAAELPGEQIMVVARAEATVLVDLVIFRADYYAAAGDDEVYYKITDPDFNEHYVEAQSELVVEIEMSITAGADAADAEVEIMSVSLAPVEIVHRALDGRRGQDLLDSVRAQLPGKHVDDYTPDEPIESEIEEASVLSVYRGGSARLRELIESDGDRQICQLEVHVDADVDWMVTAPTPFDAAHFAALALNEESGAPILQGNDSHAPLVVDLTATWDPASGWQDLDVDTVNLESTVAKQRAATPTASENLLNARVDEEWESRD